MSGGMYSVIVHVLPFMSGRSVLPIKLLLYKIQRDGNRLQKFGSGPASGVGALDSAIGGRLDFRGAARAAGVHNAIRAIARRCWHWLAHSHRTAHSGDARDSAHRSVFRNDLLNGIEPALVCLGVAV